LAHASLFIYVSHLPLVVAGQQLMSCVAAPIWSELPAIVIATLAIPLALYELLIRGTRIGRLLGVYPPIVQR